MSSKSHSDHHSRHFKKSKLSPTFHLNRHQDRQEKRYKSKTSRYKHKHFSNRKEFEAKKIKNETESSKANETKVEIKKEEPNFSLSGKLAEDTNMFNGVLIKYNQPPEAEIPKRKWRLYPFKGEEPLPYISLSKQSAFLLGRDRKVVDLPIDHPSCSKQHAVIQFRCVSYERSDGTIGKHVRPYLIDLESSNGTYLNNNKIDTRRYYELFEKDVIKFGYSSREYVLLTEDFKDDN